MKNPFRNDHQSEPPRAVFTQRLSLRMLWVATIGGFYVLVDPYIAYTFANGIVIAVGKEGGAFADQMKGAVVMLMLVGGFTAVKEFWLGGSAGEKAQGATLSRIAEQAPSSPTTNVSADTAVVNQGDKK